MRAAIRVLTAVSLVSAAAHARADVLYSSGTFVTNPTGGTGAIAGLPISQAEPFTVPGQPFVFSTTGLAATVATDTAAAEDFTVPAGEVWDLDRVTLYAFQTSQTTPTITSVHINLWTAPPFSAGSPPPVPDPLPQPVLAQPLVLTPTVGDLVAHRQSSSSTSTVRPVFPYTVSLDGLPNGGRLGPGTYWLEWSFVGATSPSANVFMPLVTPRSQVAVHNARLYNALDSSGTRVWFETREGFVAGQSEGRAVTFPLVLEGARSTTPACRADFNNSGSVSVQDIFDFLAAYFGNDPRADINGSGGVSVQDIFDFLALYFAGC